MFNLSLTACSFHLRKTNSRGNGEVDKEIMWRGYRYSTAIVAGTHCAFLTMRGYNEYEIYTVLPGMCYNYCSRIVY